MDNNNEGSVLGKGSYGKVIHTSEGALKKFSELGESIYEIMIMKILTPPRNTNIDNIILPIKTDYNGKKRAFQILMEQGSSDLFKYLQTNKNPPKKSIMYKIANGLKNLHEANIAHFDIKLQNIIMFGDEPRIGDYGLSQFVPCDNNIPNHEIVTITYRPLEVFSRKSLTKSVDIWSLGILFYEIYSSNSNISDDNDGKNNPLFYQTDDDDNDDDDDNFDDDIIIKLLKRLLVRIKYDKIPFNNENFTPEENEQFKILISNMLTQERYRYDIYNVINHPFFNEYPNVTYHSCLDNLEKLDKYPVNNYNENIPRRIVFRKVTSLVKDIVGYNIPLISSIMYIIDSFVAIKQIDLTELDLIISASCYLAITIQPSSVSLSVFSEHKRRDMIKMIKNICESLNFNLINLTPMDYYVYWNPRFKVSKSFLNLYYKMNYNGDVFNHTSKEIYESIMIKIEES